jgi:hypothetical protein
VTVNNYSYGSDTPRGMGWGWLIGVALAVWVAVMYMGYGPQAPTKVPTSDITCQYAVPPSGIASWIDRLGGWADYRGGYWYDASGSVVGKSSAEDSDVCSFVK